MAETTDRRAVEVVVTGTVQGVGFRPFVARTAAEYDLDGRVRNTDRGVVVRFEGAPDAVSAAVDRLRSDPPPLASVDAVTASDREPTGDGGFDIDRSTADEERTTLVPPDTGLCPACRDDIRDPDSRFAGYWATSCVDCGPRFAVTEALPYDRERTAMAAFPLCEDCKRAYEDPTDRRFHAQTVACPTCGPTLSLRDADGTERATGTAALDRLATRLRAGEIVGIKGTGGAHLSCLATDPEAVERLRERTGRPAKPFAVMAPSPAAVERFASVSEAEAETLTDQRRPITVLDGNGATWLDAVAPGLHTVGVMLPYSGLHHLLFDRLDAPLVMTSANPPGRPMCTTNDALLDLDCIDAALVHDRRIVARCDDSVVRHVDGERRFLRRSRGWVPERLPNPVDAGATVLAVGGRSDVTVAVADGSSVVPSQHVGAVDDPATAAFLREATDHLLSLCGTDPDVVAHDHHPGFRTTDVADDLAGESHGVYHHHAHAAALLGEHERERAVVVAADGTGYGPDGVVRGGEVLDATLSDSGRVGGLSEFRLPGGEAAVERPARILAALFDEERAVAAVARDPEITLDAAATIHEQAASGLNSPPTSSAGRFLDAVSALLGCCHERRYRGEPALRLEALAARGDPIDVEPPVERRGGERVLVADEAMTLIADLAADRPARDVAATAQRLLADGLATVAIRTARERDRSAVGFTGGVAYNDAITRRFRERVEAAGHTFLGHRDVPPGDGGLAYGQAVAASARLSDACAPGSDDEQVVE